ncbi:hypothetical protein BDDG_13039 [Blastomyces dermatitidis ATCC 18188]|uniref:Uncharacterized protein n=1 Tax=Ajellomyces dermatitidis (strain ATCC 18188 / CBS 674.68) TaxID=653446 RepID=A0A0J9HI16_AJEDA|nr:hypothetical protein BDDG_13039 [Blastomyces dermatitidis ATCC 18188]
MYLVRGDRQPLHEEVQFPACSPKIRLLDNISPLPSNGSKKKRTIEPREQTNKPTNQPTQTPPRTCCPAELESVGGDGSKMLTRQVRSVWELDVTPSNWNGGTAPREGE